ncbi:hypothetical protein CERSUDRAFT_99497 [Gelatoporia subvermispora B]|uniref:Uncharacterized protein n=1 Tax=Ceriporiopsis subvermispora (strain B) TaxID=914234 RepID=M2PAB5_CERS8|nr:hypothetical protein CERSUDRAFT_99497 [Gelatoporia subvermispora B]
MGNESRAVALSLGDLTPIVHVLGSSAPPGTQPFRGVCQRAPADSPCAASVAVRPRRRPDWHEHPVPARSTLRTHPDRARRATNAPRIATPALDKPLMHRHSRVSPVATSC